ncbi:MAG: rRNA maturation RNase YbeY [Gemmatimonadaceae bacterium]
MSVAVDIARDGVRVPLAAERVREIVRAVCKRERVPEALISVTFVSDRKIARLNREFLGHAGATDVIAFELAPTAGAVVGDIYIAVNVARENARTHGVGVREELVRLVVHGTLHVLGHCHAEDDERTTGDMWRKQEKLVAALV